MAFAQHNAFARLRSLSVPCSFAFLPHGNYVESFTAQVLDRRAPLRDGYPSRRLGLAQDFS